MLPLTELRQGEKKPQFSFFLLNVPGSADPGDSWLIFFYSTDKGEFDVMNIIWAIRSHSPLTFGTCLKQNKVTYTLTERYFRWKLSKLFTFHMKNLYIVF